jgi:hypothetical protein
MTNNLVSPWLLLKMVVVFVFIFFLTLTSIILQVVHSAGVMPFLFGMQLLLNSVHDFPKSSNVETNMDFAVSRCSGMGLDYMRDIECLIFVMTNTNYFMVSQVQNNYCAISAHSLGPGLQMLMKNVTRGLIVQAHLLQK